MQNALKESLMEFSRLRAGDMNLIRALGTLTYLDEVKFELDKELQNKTGLSDKLTTSLTWLQSKHPEMYQNKRAVKEVIDYVLNKPTTIKDAKSKNSVLMGKMKDKKMADIVVNKDENKIIHANLRKPNSKEKEAVGEDALHSHSDTMPDGALMLADKQRSTASNGEILPEKSLNLLELLKQKQEKEKLAFKNLKEQMMKFGKDKPQKDLKQQFNELVSANQAEQKLKDDRIKDFKDRVMNLNKNNDLLDKNKPLRMAKPEELTSELLKEAQNKNVKIWLDDFKDKTLIEELGFNTKEKVKMTMQGDTIKHILNRHGENSTMALNGQPAISEKDIKNHAKLVNNADKKVIRINKSGQKVLVSGKQINGHYIIVETISTKQNELKLKTMYKENGRLENNEIFKHNAVID